jgi:farnesyl-diphosphate farnesyltransferase
MKGLEGQDRRRCAELLPSVSRTFALTISVLPRPLRDPMTIAYLLCRMADILEDATAVDPGKRVEGLESLAHALANPLLSAQDLVHVLDGYEEMAAEDPAALRLLRDRPPVMRAYTGLPPGEREVISHWVQAMALGMASYVGRERRPRGEAGAAPAAGVPFVLETSDELRAYATFVAGTVGYMVTELFARHLGRSLGPKDRLRELALPFGLGLQFTNILQDVAEDRLRGWSYIPEELARRHGTSARNLDAPAERPAALRVIGDLVHEAAGYLDGAMEYSLLLPRRAPRLRLFCLWPTFFALRTLGRIWGDERLFLSSEKIRISRQEVRQIVRRTSMACFVDGWLKELYQQERARLDQAIALRPI